MIAVFGVKQIKSDKIYQKKAQIYIKWTQFELNVFFAVLLLRIEILASFLDLCASSEKKKILNIILFIIVVRYSSW